MNTSAVKISELTQALSRIPEAELDTVAACVQSILADAQVPKRQRRSLKGIWAGIGFESIVDLDAEIRTIRRELQDAILNRAL